MVNARHTKTLPGRKTDVQECQWLQKLHTFGLLNNSFLPSAETRVLRTYLRQRENLVAAAGTCIQHRQKVLTEMNVQLAKRDQRPEWSDGDGHFAGDREGRAGTRSAWRG